MLCKFWVAKRIALMQISCIYFPEFWEVVHISRAWEVKNFLGFFYRNKFTFAALEWVSLECYVILFRNKRCCAQQNVPAKRLIICYILCISEIKFFLVVFHFIQFYIFPDIDLLLMESVIIYDIYDFLTKIPTYTYQFETFDI